MTHYFCKLEIILYIFFHNLEALCFFFFLSSLDYRKHHSLGIFLAHNVNALYYIYIKIR